MSDEQLVEIVGAVMTNSAHTTMLVALEHYAYWCKGRAIECDTLAERFDVGPDRDQCLEDAAFWNASSKQAADTGELLLDKWENVADVSLDDEVSELVAPPAPEKSWDR